MEIFEGKRVGLRVSETTYATGTIVRSDYLLKDEQPNASIYHTNTKNGDLMVWVYFDEANDQKISTRRFAGSMLTIYIEDITEI